MKKKLLITLGCSFTEGVGCYNPELVLKLKAGIIDRSELEDLSFDRFHANSWPPRLQKKLNYDHLINIGKGGSGESYQFKRFIEEFGGQDLSEEYEVLVCWLQQPPGRLSFYRAGLLTTIHPSNPKPFYDEDYLGKAYAMFIREIDLDMCLEQVMHIKAIRDICVGRKYKFLIFPGFMTKDYVAHLSKFLDVPEDMSKYYHTLHESNGNLLPQLNSMKSLICDHPNEKGYEFIAHNMFKIILLHDPEIINNAAPVEATREWRDRKYYKWD
jgi:hypothetical protein